MQSPPITEATALGWMFGIVQALVLALLGWILRNLLEVKDRVARMEISLFGAGEGGQKGIAFHAEKTRGRIHEHASWIQKHDWEIGELYHHLKIPRRDRRASDHGAHSEPPADA